MHYLTYFWEIYFNNRAPKIASLGCGSGHLERSLISINCSFSNIVGYEINPTLVRFANDEIKRLGVTTVSYIESDLNNISITEPYDLIIFFHSLHHVENLEHCLDEVYGSLTKDGLVLVVDFVGPDRFQWTDKQIGYAQDLLNLLPDYLKKDCSRNAEIIKKEIIRPSIKSVVSGDPSEAIRSSDIMDLLYAKYKVIEHKPMGGTILNLLFSAIAGNFDERDDLMRSLILSFQKYEETLMHISEIPSDFVFMVLGRKDKDN